MSINWALSTLQGLGYVIQKPGPDKSVCNELGRAQQLRKVENQDGFPQLILQTLWSCVYRFDTDQGHCFLKQVPSGLSLEPQVINLLRETCGASVPLLIADNPQAHCFLMQDAGIPLREHFKLGFNSKLLITAIHDYIAVQRKSIPHLDRFLNLGVSNWRLAKIPACYVTLIQQEALLTADGLTYAEIEQLSKLTPNLVQICEQLSQYPIPDVFSHNDFHENNLLIDPKTQKVTMVDLGEVAVTHPFFSLLNILHQIKKYCVLPEDTYQHLQRQALQPWLDCASHDQLLAVMSLIQQCWSIHRALTVYRLLTSIEAKSAKQILGQGKFAKNLRVWLAQ